MSEAIERGLRRQFAASKPGRRRPAEHPQGARSPGAGAASACRRAACPGGAGGVTVALRFSDRLVFLFKLLHTVFYHNVKKQMRSRELSANCVRHAGLMHQRGRLLKGRERPAAGRKKGGRPGLRQEALWPRDPRAASREAEALWTPRGPRAAFPPPVVQPGSPPRQADPLPEQPRPMPSPGPGRGSPSAGEGARV